MGNIQLKCDCITKDNNEIESLTKEKNLNNNNNKLNTNDNLNLNENLNKKKSIDTSDNFKMEKLTLSPIRESLNDDSEIKNNLDNKLKYINQKNNKTFEFSSNLTNDEKIEDLLKKTESSNSINMNNNTFIWKDINILSVIPESKLRSDDKNIIVHFGYLNKFLLNNSLNNVKYCLLSKSHFCIYKSKETLLMKQKPVLMIKLNDKEKCDSIEMNFLNRKNLENCFFFYILKKNIKYRNNNNVQNFINFIDYEKNSDVYNILFSKKNVLEKIILNNDLIILYSDNEEVCDKWVCCINYFLNEIKNEKKK